MLACQVPLNIIYPRKKSWKENKEVPENERVSAQGFVETTRRIRCALYDQERVVRFAKLVYVPHLALKLITPN